MLVWQPVVGLVAVLPLAAAPSWAQPSQVELASGLDQSLHEALFEATHRVVPGRAGTLAGGTLAACDGSFAQDLNALWCPSCPKPAKNPGAGALVQAQLWYRDPLSTSNQTTSLSDAIEFSVAP